MYRVLFVVSILTLSYCASTPDEQQQPQKQADRKLSLSCSGGAAVLTRVDSKGKPGERGQVDPKPMTCEAAAKLDDKGLSKLKRIGKWEYFVDSVLSRREEYAAGLKEGPETGYFPDGSIRYTGQNSADKKTGHWKIKADASKGCESEGDFENDLKTGRWVECKGNIKEPFIEFEGSYVQGLRDGPGKFLNSEGKVSSQGDFRADLGCKAALKPGASKQDFDRCAKRTGHWVYYHSNGEKSTEGDFDPATGLETGTWHEFYRSGEKLGMGPRTGDRKGLWTFYGKDGSILYQLEFAGSDFLPKTAIFWKDGKKSAQGPLSMGMFKFSQDKDAVELTSPIKDGIWTEYYPNGQKSGEGNYTSNRRDGKWTLYDESGKKIGEGPYMMDKKDGEWLELEGGAMVKKKYQFGKPARF